MRLKIGSQNAEIKLSKVQTYNFDASFLKTAKLEMEQSSSRATICLFEEVMCSLGEKKG